MFLVLLLLRITRKEFSFSGPLDSPASFGFTSEGQYVLTVHSSSLTPLVFGLVATSNYELLPKYDVNDTVIENLTVVHSVYTDGDVNVTGEITSRGVYRIFLVSGISEHYTVTLSADFWNGNSRLDYRGMNALVEQPLGLSLFVILLVIWLVNWAMNCGTGIYIHYCLTSVICLGVVSRVVRLIFLFITNKYDLLVGAQVVAVLFMLLFHIDLWFVLILCAKGWCIVRQRIRVGELPRSIVVAAIFLILQSVVDNVVLTRTANVLLLIALIVALLLYAREIIRSTRVAFQYIYAYLLEISNAGIDPESTPVWHKAKMFTRFQYCILAYCSLLLAQMIVTGVISDYPWVGGLVEDITDLGIIVGLEIVFRLKEPRSNAYAMIDGAEPELVLEDIEGAKDKKLTRGGKQWETGMSLPPPPGSALTGPGIVLIKSPEGVFEVSLTYSPAGPV
jgi:hypothetical protein